jgi:hypothetical protein
MMMMMMIRVEGSQMQAYDSWLEVTSRATVPFNEVMLPNQIIVWAEREPLQRVEDQDIVSLRDLIID